MQLVIKNGKIVATHLDSQNIVTAYPQATVITVADGTTAALGQAWEVTLDQAKGSATARIDAAAETLRQRVLTPGSGQAAEYYLTHAEAAGYLAAVAAGKTPDETAYPFLRAEQAALQATTGAVSLADVATAIMADVSASGTLLADIKQARRTGKLAVGAATDEAGLAAAETAVAWPSSTENGLRRACP